AAPQLGRRLSRRLRHAGRLADLLDNPPRAGRMRVAALGDEVAALRAGFLALRQQRQHQPAVRVVPRAEPAVGDAELGGRLYVCPESRVSSEAAAKFGTSTTPTFTV